MKSITAKTLFLIGTVYVLYLGILTGKRNSFHSLDSTTICNRQNGKINSLDDSITDINSFSEVEKKRISILVKDKLSLLKINSNRFGPELFQVAVGAIAVEKGDFVTKYDYGVADYPNSGEEQVLILYNNYQALPDNNNGEKKSSPAVQFGEKPLTMSVENATANCDIMNVALNRMQTKKQCIALVDGYDSFIMQHWMRVHKKVGGLSRENDLIHVGRGKENHGGNQFCPPTTKAIDKHWNTQLLPFIKSVDKLLDELRPIAESVKKENTIIVMVVNKGQSVLLMNFVCSTKAKGFDISNVLLFATDLETLELARGLGVTAYYDKWNAASVPTKEARRYGDRAFTAMMFQKVISVALINLLGYDLLFMDVDIVWYKEPLNFFHSDESVSQYDIMFQDDGARSIRYAPYSANSGFYYVRHNERTTYLFTRLLNSGELIIESKSHQQALGIFLEEHSSLYGLKVKTLSNAHEFPGGYHYHRHSYKQLLRKITSGEVVPFLFHMCWTNNKDDKLLYMKQMGMWYVNEKCIDKNAATILGVEKVKEDFEIVSPCCSTKPLITCHYSDKPSAIDCRDSPTKDKRKV
mmetsp:Transcript_24051/g.29542  ORF Transcript_24051/g.29542 Transcript_24051/m.29542 type:complete len:581 (-) Transcript_24051:98-1840(-)